MKPPFSPNSQLYILQKLSSLPRKMLLLHGSDNTTEFVLHDLCHQHCFNLCKAAYLVDNPDFDCIQGVAGFCQQEAYPQEDIWQSPDKFSSHMKEASFNKQVRNFTQPSYHNTQEGISNKTIQEIAQKLNFENAHYCCLDMKHNNKGILIYQPQKESETQHEKDDMVNALSLLSFCPVF